MSNSSQQGPVRCLVWWLEILATVVYLFVVLFGAAVLLAVVCLVQRGQVAGCAINPRHPLIKFPFFSRPAIELG